MSDEISLHTLLKKFKILKDHGQIFRQKEVAYLVTGLLGFGLIFLCSYIV